MNPEQMAQMQAMQRAYGQEFPGQQAQAQQPPNQLMGANQIMAAEAAKHQQQKRSRTTYHH